MVGSFPARSESGVKMKRKIKEMFESLAQETRLQFSEADAALWGELKGYPVVVYSLNANDPKELQAVFGGSQWLERQPKELRKAVKGIKSVEATPTSVLVSFRCTNAQASAELLSTTANELRQGGLKRGCQRCGQDVPTVGANVAGAYLSLCEECFATLRGQMEVSHSQYQTRRESVLAGTIGALLGSLLGVAAIVIVSRLGYVAAVTGVVMAVCTLLGYEKLGTKLTKKGVVICSVIMLGMTYIANQLDWAILIMQEFGSNFFEAYQSISILLGYGVIEAGSYWWNLALVYVFLLLGAVPMIISKLRNQTVKDRISRMDQADRSSL